MTGQTTRAAVLPIIAASTLIATSWLIGAAQAEPVGPRVKTPQEVFDFGVTPQYSEVSHVFWLRSTGDEKLVIEKMIPNCGCTEAPLEKNEIVPGDSARAEIIFGSATFDGPVRKFTQIVSNSTGRAPALTFTADVYPDSLMPGPLVLTPAAVRLDDLRLDPAGDGYEQTVTLKNTGKSPLTVDFIDVPFADVRLSQTGSISLAPGESHPLTLTFGSDLPQQVFSRSITFAVSDPAQNRVTLPIFKKSAWDVTSENGS